MHPQFTQVEGVDQLDTLLHESGHRPVVLFKHSFTCGISAEALDELLALLNETTVDVRYAMVTVQTHRDVSNAVVKKLGVRHETPQALVIRGGQVVWAGSHFRVTANALDAAIRKAAAQ
jgi:bacillithiol system protein YtxJ